MQASVYECDARVAGEELTGEVDVDSSQDYTGLVDFSRLTSETCYEVEVTFAASATSSTNGSDAESTPAYATFVTAPLPSVTRAVRFAWGGDIAGQNICRDAEEGFPVMEALNSLQGLDFFLNVGDAIYGDARCEDVGLGQNAQVEGDFARAADLDNFWAHWRYNLEDPGYLSLLSKQAFFMTWDDHEVINDFGPGADEGTTGAYTPGESLLPIGLQAFLNYNPIRATVDPTEPLAFYRTVRWGASVELFILDTRQYRSLPTDEDTAANPKTMLGDTQLTWLKDSLTSSTALWKLVVTSVPLSVPTGPGDEARDGWANWEGNTGYERELEDILTHMKDEEIHNAVFITADVHFAQSLRYQPFGNNTDFDFYEIIVGPLNAGPFNRPDLDETFAPERLFYYAPEETTADLDGDYSYSEDIRPFFNFGVADIDVNGNLTFSVINTDNETLYSVTLPPREGTVLTDATPAPSSPATPSPSLDAVTPSPSEVPVTPSPSAGEGDTSSDITDTPAPSTSSSTSTSSPEEGGDEGDDDSSDTGVGGKTNGAPPRIRPLLRLVAFLVLGTITFSRIGGM
ncbi:unnamed protein product [Scytosiphon promiscuus]